MGVELIRFDMSEYMERHAVSRLIGAPPGYVGFDQGGLLTERSPSIRTRVLLLDEIEKAHPDIFNILLQVMDHGTLTDNNGRKADFRNVDHHHDHQRGRGRARRRPRWASRRRKAAGDEMGEIKRMFTPEFRNRLDATISFARARPRDHPARGRQVPACSSRTSCTRRRSRSTFTRGAQGVPGEERLRSADGRAADGAAHPGHDPQARSPTSCCSASSPAAARSRSTSTTTSKVQLVFEEAPKESPKPVA